MRCVAMAGGRMLVAIGVVPALTAAPGEAGTYRVVGACGNCPGLILRNVGGPFHTRVPADGQWFFLAPAGTTILNAELAGWLHGQRG